MKLIGFFLIAVVTVGCGGGSAGENASGNSSSEMTGSSSSQTQYASALTLSAESVAVPPESLVPGALLPVRIELIANRSVDKMLVFTYLSNVEENRSVWIDSDMIEKVAADTARYDINVSMPTTMEVGTYRLDFLIIPDTGEADGNGSVMAQTQTESFAITEAKAHSQLTLEVIPDEANADDSDSDDEQSEETNGTVHLAAPVSVTGGSALALTVDFGEDNISVNTLLRLHNAYADIGGRRIFGCIEWGGACQPLPVWISRDENASAELENGVIYVDAIEANSDAYFGYDFVMQKEQLLEWIEAMLTQLKSDPLHKPNMEASVKITVAPWESNVSVPGDGNETKTFVIPLSIDLAEDAYRLLVSNLPALIAGTLTPEELWNAAQAGGASGETQQLIDILMQEGGGNTEIPDINDVDDLLNNIHLASQARAGSTCIGRKLTFSKTYEKYKYGERFGAGLYTSGKIYLDSTGLHTRTYASVRAKVLTKKTKYRLLRYEFNADANPGSFEDTGYDMRLSFRGTTLYVRSKSLADVSGLSTPTVTLTESEKSSLSSHSSSADVNVSSSISNSSSSASSSSSGDVTSERTLLLRKKYRLLKSKISSYSGSGSTYVSYAYEKKYGKTIEHSVNFVLGIVPITVTAGAEATIGFEADAGLTGITALEADVTPTARVGAYLYGGVGSGLKCCGQEIEYSAGVGGDFYLISDDFKNSVEASMKLVESNGYVTRIDGTLHENVTNYFYGPHGRFYIYAKWFGPESKDDPLDWDQHKRTKMLTKFSSTKVRSTLLNKTQQLFTIPLADECD